MLTHIGLSEKVFIMSRFLLIFILTLSFQTLTKADDIIDFQIEGMSVGESLLDYFSKSEIKNKKKPILAGGKYYYQYNKFNKDHDNKLYDRVVLFFKTNDKNYIIQAISGRNYYVSNINECYDVQTDIVKQIEMIMVDTKKIGPRSKKISSFPNGKSYKKEVGYLFKNNSFIRVVCYDYSKKDTNSRDRLSVQIATQEYNKWLASKDKK